MKKVTWTIGTGKTATVTITMEATETTVRDDWAGEIKTGKYTKATSVVAEVEGMGYIGAGLDFAAKGNGNFAANIGKLGFTAEILNKIEAAITAEENREIAENAGYAKFLNKIEAVEKMEDEYNKHTNTVTAMMAE